MFSAAFGADFLKLFPHFMEAESPNDELTGQFFHHLNFGSCALLNRLDGFSSLPNDLGRNGETTKDKDKTTNAVRDRKEREKKAASQPGRSEKSKRWRQIWNS